MENGVPEVITVQSVTPTGSDLPEDLNGPAVTAERILKETDAIAQNHCGNAIFPRTIAPLFTRLNAQYPADIALGVSPVATYLG